MELTITFTGPPNDRLKFMAVKDILACHSIYQLINKTNDVFTITIDPAIHGALDDVNDKDDKDESYLELLFGQINTLVRVRSNITND